MIIKNLWRRKIRALLTAIGIAIGVAAVVYDRLDRTAALR